MDTLKIYFSGIAPLSTNKSKSTNRNGQYYKNTAKATIQKRIQLAMLEFTNDCMEFKKAFKKKDEYLVISYHWEVPQHLFFNKDGSISSKKMDWDNTIKVFQDAVFKNIGIPDQAIIDGFVQQRPTEKDYFVKIHITRMVIDF